MKKVILAVVIGISAISFVSCGNTEVNEDNIKDKYNVDNFNYEENGISVDVNLDEEDYNIYKEYIVEE